MTALRLVGGTDVRSVKKDLSCFVVTHSGLRFDFINITDNYINWKDICWHLARINRYCGGTEQTISVGEHTLKGDILIQEVARINGLTDEETLHLRREWFMHDGPEFVLNDISSPLKSLLPDFKRIESRVSNYFGFFFNLKTLPESHYALVKEVDKLAFLTECRTSYFGFPCSIEPNRCTLLMESLFKDLFPELVQ